MLKGTRTVVSGPLAAATHRLFDDHHIYFFWLFTVMMSLRCFEMAVPVAFADLTVRACLLFRQPPRGTTFGTEGK